MACLDAPQVTEDKECYTRHDDTKNHEPGCITWLKYIFRSVVDKTEAHHTYKNDNRCNDSFHTELRIKTGRHENRRSTRASCNCRWGPHERVYVATEDK